MPTPTPRIITYLPFVLNSHELTVAMRLLSVAICAQALLVLKTNADTDTQNHHIFTICAQFTRTDRSYVLAFRGHVCSSIAGVEN
jgi:hypothetical protein